MSTSTTSLFAAFSEYTDHPAWQSADPGGWKRTDFWRQSLAPHKEPSEMILLSIVEVLCAFPSMAYHPLI